MSSSCDHYFSAEPLAPDERMALTVPIAGRTVTVQTAPGVFSADGIDLGTSVLLKYAPAPPWSGDLLDLGCGWGPIGLTMASLSPQARVWGVDVNARALSLTRANADGLGLDNLRTMLPTQVPETVLFSAIWSNPPIRVGKSALHELLHQWLPRLLPGASAYLVVQRNLGSDSLHTWLIGTLGRDFETTRHASAKGFRVLRVRRLSDSDTAPA